MPNLMRLYLRYCRNLKVVHPSIGNLSKLVLLDLSKCSELENLPSFNQVSSLKSLNLHSCKKLKILPEIKTKTPHLVELHLRKVGIIELSSSIQQLHGLTKLLLDGCEHLVCLCDDLFELKNLIVLEIKNCTNLKSLPENLKGLISLEYLSLEGSDFDSLPESINQLPHLQYLDIRYCRKLEVMPKLPKTISQLYAHLPFAFNGNIVDVAKECSELHSLALSIDDDGFIWPGYLSAKMCIGFLLDRKTPFSFNSPLCSLKDPPIGASVLRLFQYRCYESNGISIDLNPSWYCQSFVGFAVYFIFSYIRSSKWFIWGPKYFGNQDTNHVMHCTIIVKLSHKNNENEVLQRKCVIAKLHDHHNEIDGDICFVYIPFSSLWPAESNTINDFSRFEVNFMNLEATANWGCSLLYKRRKRPASWDDSRPGHTTDIGPLGMLKYLNLKGKEFEHFLPEDISRLRLLQYLDISGCRRLRELPELPPTIRELYAACRLVSESNIAELATKYSELYSVSFSFPFDNYSAFHGNIDKLVPGELAKKFIPITQPFLNRNTPFAVTYPLQPYTDYKISECFKYPHHDPHHDPHKISISLDPNWYNHSFVGFVVCFVFPRVLRWESHPDILPFRHCELIAKLTHKDNGSEPAPLQTKCVIGRLYDEEFDNSVDELVCFAYIPFSNLWSKSKAIMDNITPNHYMVFEASIQDLKISRIKPSWCPQSIMYNATPNWSCGLLYTDDESLTEAIRRKREAGSIESDLEEEEEEEEDDEDEEEEEDGGSQHTEDSGGDDAMAENNNAGHSAESPIDTSDDELEPLEYGDSGGEGESIDGDEDVEEYESDAGHSSGTSFFTKSRRDLSRIDMFIKAEQGEYLRVLNQHNDYWKQRDKQFWLKEGDTNSSYFHKTVRRRRQNNAISRLEDSNGQLVLKGTERIDDEEASMAEKSVIDAALFEEIHAFTQHNPIIEKEIQSDHNYHIEEDYETTTSQHELGPNRTKLWEIVDQVQCRMVSMPECSDAKVIRLLYTNSGVSILALSSDGIQKLWKWPNNEQNSSGKAAANFVPQHWQPNSGLMINDVVGVNLEKVIPCIALSNDDSYIVSAAGRKVSLFNIMTFEVMETITLLPSASTFLAFDPHDDNIIAIGTEKSTIYIYDRIDKELNELEEHQKPITGLAFSIILKLLVSSDADAQLCSWNTRLWKKKRSVRIQLPTGEVCSGDTHVMFHVDQLHLLVTHETQLAIYDASKMELINQWIPNGSFSAPISSATFSCNCQLIYASFKDGNIGVFDAHRWLRPRCRIAPSAYLSQAVLNRNEGVYAVVIAAHPQEPNQLAFGLTDGSVKVIEPLESEGEWGIEILNGKEGEDEKMGDEEGGHQWEQRKKARLDKGKAPLI